MGKFNFSEELLQTWQDQAIFLKGEKATNVVLVHGWSALPRQLLGMLETINQQGYTVCAPLLKGHGTKPEDLEQVVAQDWIDDVVKEIRRLRQAGAKKIVAGGISMGGNAALLASLEEKVDGIVLIGTPVHLKNHLWVWAGSFLVPLFAKYLKKNYPKEIDTYQLETTSYQYYPVSSVRECLRVIRKSVLLLHKIKVPILILQTNKDYLVSKYSPWIIYNTVKSKFKKMQWIKTKNNSHVLSKQEEEDSMHLILNFLAQVEDDTLPK